MDIELVSNPNLYPHEKRGRRADQGIEERKEGGQERTVTFLNSHCLQS